ncbi:MAG TPA: UPF0147 family protein, partial [Methanomicrobiales archaeon]|nr:UPF0147 family protein [Methanomicrobiales archaeon]
MANPENTINSCVQMLSQIMDDTTIPRNIRRVADETKNVLTDDSKTIGLRAATAISM